MAEAREPGGPEVTIRGGPVTAPPAPPRRPALRPVLVGSAALLVAAGVVLGQRQVPPPTEPRCPAPCPAPGSLVLGAALPTSGVLAPFGRAQQRGVQRVVDQVNADGGLEVAGTRRRLELLVRDTRSVPDVAGQEALVLVRGPFDVVGLVGPCSPPVAMVRVAESRQVPLVSGCQPLPPVTAGPVRRTWEVAPEESWRARAVFEALGSSPAGRVGLFLSNDRAPAPWTSAAASAGVVPVATYRPQGGDWSSAVAQAASDGVEVVVAVTQPPEGIGLWTALRDGGLVPQQAYASEAGLGSAWYAAVGRSGDGTLTDVVHPLNGPATPAQVDEGVAAVSSELTRLVVDGLRQARTAERPALQEALRGARARVAGTDVRLQPGQEGRLPVRLGRWEDGRLVPVSASR